MKFNENLFLVPWMPDLGLGDRYEQVLGQVAALLVQGEDLELERMELERGATPEHSAAPSRRTADHHSEMTTRRTDMSRRTTQRDWIGRMTLRSGGDIGTLPRKRRHPAND